MTPEKGTPDYTEQVDSIIRAIRGAGITAGECKATMAKAMSLYMKDPEISRSAIAEAARELRGE